MDRDTTWTYSDGTVCYRHAVRPGHLHTAGRRWLDTRRGEVFGVAEVIHASSSMVHLVDTDGVPRYLGVVYGGRVTGVAEVAQ